MVICGFHAVEESLRSGAHGSLLISRSGPRGQALKTLAEGRGIAVRSAAVKELNRICGHDRHQGVVLLCESPGSPGTVKVNLQTALGAIQGGAPLILLLDELNDPRNLGAVLRSADQFGVDLVATTIRRSAPQTPGVTRASAGASRYVPLVPVGNLVQAIETCKRSRYWIYGADLDGESLQTVSFDGPVALVMGGEHRGLRRLVRERCDFLVRIPSRGRVDSFNVSVAAGILLYEIRRQQGFPAFP